MSGRDYPRGQRRDLERRARAAIRKMPRPRTGDDIAEYLLKVERWIERTEREVAGERPLLNRIVELAAMAMREHVIRHPQESSITSQAADNLIEEAGVSAETIANAHLFKHWLSARERSCVPLGPRGEDTVVVCYSPEEARTRIWCLGEAEDDPEPETVERWRRGLCG